MKKKEIIKSIQTEFAKGASRDELFSKYSGMGLTYKKLTYVMGTLRDEQLLAKHKNVHILLLVLMVLTIVVSFVVTIALQFPLWLTVMILGGDAIFLIGFIKKTHWGYLWYFLLLITNAPKLLRGLGDNIAIDSAIVIYWFSMIFLVLFLKFKYYPEMRIFTPKQFTPKQVDRGQSF